MSLVLDGLTYTYPSSQAGVRDVSFEIRPGELLAVIGPSGCGKTTILKLVAGFLRPDGGRILVDGVDASDTPARARGMGVVFQSYALFPHMSALQNVAYPLRIRGVAASERRTRALEALGLVGLAREAERRPAQLSGGQQQRVALARALVFRPRALLLDEPLSALDAARRVETRDEILRVQKAAGIATLHITHDQEEALSMADRVAVMGEGRLLQVGTPREIYERPASRAVASFVGHANLIPGTVRDAGSIDTPFGLLAASSAGRAPGSAVTLLVRPERVALGPAPDGLNTVQGAVVRDRYLGSLRRLDLEAGGHRLTVETAQAGEVSTVHLPPSAIQVLAAEA